jgi:hypothetical protein
MPLTLAAGVIAKLSVSSIPIAGASSSSNSLRFSVWSGHAG